MDKGLNHFESELEGIRREIGIEKGNGGEIKDLRKEMTMNFRWIIGVQFTTWITLIGLF